MLWTKEKGQRRHWHLTPLTIFVSAVFMAAFFFGGLAVTREALQISNLAKESLSKIVPMIAQRQTAVVNIERLKQYGMIIQTAGEPQLRAEARILAAVLTSHPGFQFDPDLSNAIQHADKVITGLAKARDDADDMRRSGRAAAADETERIAVSNWRATQNSLTTLSDSLSESAANLTRSRAIAVEQAAEQVTRLALLGLSSVATMLACLAVLVHRLLLRPILLTTAALNISNHQEKLALPTSNIVEIDLLYRSTEKMATAIVEIEEANRQARALQADLRRLASTDELTGLANRRWFMEMAARELERCKRFNHPFSVLMVDVDHFKDVNDTFGHAAGDLVLVGLARALEESLRAIDILGRIGGEEFAAGLPQASEENARATAERLRTNVEMMDVTLEDGRVLKVTASVGVTMINPDDTSLDVLLARADKALYAAKGGGRNRVVVL